MSFKRCSCCRQDWTTRGDFLADPAIALVGYQAFLDEGQPGLFLFNHTDCGTTLAIPLDALGDLQDLPVFEPSPSTAFRRPDQCLIRAGSKPCPPSCECSWVAGMLRTLASWPKDTPGAGHRQQPPSPEGVPAARS